MISNDFDIINVKILALHHYLLYNTIWYYYLFNERLGSAYCHSRTVFNLLAGWELKASLFE